VGISIADGASTQTRGFSSSDSYEYGHRKPF